MLGIKGFLPICYRAHLPFTPRWQNRAVHTLNNSLLKEKCTKLMKMNFEISRPVEPFEEFKKSPSIQKLCGNDENKLRIAYRGYVQILATEKTIAEKGGNPSRML